MCGGDIQAADGAAFGACDSCGVTSTLPKAGDERLANLFNRANHFRRLNEFDKALAAYESILNEDNTNAEAHWCAVLCRYGIEYVEDPHTHMRVPTCQRAQYAPILADADYLAALENAADGHARSLYEEEAKNIGEIQKGILAISNREEPFDVFVCYKEMTDGGSRTKDSAMAQDIYYQLTKEGCRVFFARITLEDKLGQEYEPYIFAALNSAKVMLVVGTKPEHFNAVWVKNEWGRFLTLMKGDRSRLLIPCYSDMDAYDLPEELSMLQSQDMSKIGFLQDLTRGIKKVLDTGTKAGTQAVSDETPDEDVEFLAETAARMKRGHLHLEDENWDDALKCFSSVLDDSYDADYDADFDLDRTNYEYIPALIGRMCAEWKMQPEEMNAFLERNKRLLPDNSNFKETVRFFRLTEGYDMLRVKDFEAADNIFEAVLDKDPECAPAYEGKLLAELRMDGIQAFSEEKIEITFRLLPIIWNKPFSESKNYKRIIRFGSEDLRSYWESINDAYTACLDAQARQEEKRAQDAIANLRSVRERISEFQGRVAVVKGSTVVVRPDATIDIAGLVVENDPGISGWQNIVAISGRKKYQSFVGLKADGTVVTSSDDYSRNTANWRGVAAVSFGGFHIIGLKTDGTVVATDDGDGTTLNACNTANWRDIVAISAGRFHSVGLKRDGTVVATGHNGNGECNTADWRDIVAISAGRETTVGLRSDGTVIGIGSNEVKALDVQDWKDIVSISAGHGHTVGLKSDGTVVVAGFDGDYKAYPTFDLSGWRDIVAVFAGVSNDEDWGWTSEWRKDVHIVGLRADGTVVATGANKDAQCRVSKEDFEKRKRLMQRIICGICGGPISLFTKKCKKCGHSYR
jgi:tetratricopeptide (TPR) repeat protein